MVIKSLNNWFNLSKQYFFTYKEGFFNLSYLGNSPEVMVKSFAKMPFIKKDDEKQLLYADTPFVKGNFHYAELEKGLWIMSADMFYKNNVSYKPIYDNFLPADYYFISINLIENNFNKNSYKYNNFKIQNKSISFSKPHLEFSNYHFKNSREIMYIVYFNESWMKKNIVDSPSTPIRIKEFLKDSKKEFLNYCYADDYFESLVERLSTTFRTSLKPNFFELKKLAYECFTQVFLSLDKNENLNFNNLKPLDRLKMQKIEHYLMCNLYDKFPGIDTLSVKYKISPTKLKQNFKILYGSTIFIFFQQKKMELAYAVISNTDLKIKDVSLKFGYENVSKFSKAFQKHHNKLPSDLRK